MERLRPGHIDVYLVDDDALMLAAAQRVLEKAGHSIRAFSSSVEFLRSARPTSPCCVVLDLQMPEVDGLGVQAALSGTGAPISIVFLSGEAQVPHSVQAMRAGAVHFLTKPLGADELVRAVEEGLARSRRGTEALEATARARELLARLSPREREVAALLASGLRNRQVGDRLGTAEKTVKIQRGQVMRKLGITSIAELVQLLERSKGR